MSIRLRPGLIIGLSIRTEGGVHYKTEDEHTEHRNDGHTLVKEWKTRKTIEDEQEFKQATETRSKARGLIRGACISTPFGILMCPKGGEEEKKLWARVLEARTLIQVFNSDAVHSRLVLNLINGEVAASDQEAAAAIRSEIAGLLEEMQGAVKGRDVQAMRDAASRANQLGNLLEAESHGKAKLTLAVQATRSIARAVIKAGEDAEAVALAIAEEKASPVSLARFAFAGEGEDLGDEEPAPAPLPPLGPEGRRMLEMETADARAEAEREMAAVVAKMRRQRQAQAGKVAAVEEDELYEPTGEPETVPLDLCACPVCEEQAEPGDQLCGACLEAGCGPAEPRCDDDVDPEAIRALHKAATARLGLPDDTT